MRRRLLIGLALAAAAGLAGGGCSKSAPPGETVATATLPPIVPCYEPDGAPCPLDAGEDGGDDAAPNDASDATMPSIQDACLTDTNC
jgi:hypothetical protein